MFVKYFVKLPVAFILIALSVVAVLVCVIMYDGRLSQTLVYAVPTIVFLVLAVNVFADMYEKSNEIEEVKPWSLNRPFYRNYYLITTLFVFVGLFFSANLPFLFPQGDKIADYSNNHENYYIPLKFVLVNEAGTEIIIGDEYYVYHYGLVKQNDLKKKENVSVPREHEDDIEEILKAFDSSIDIDSFVSQQEYGILPYGWESGRKKCNLNGVCFTEDSLVYMKFGGIWGTATGFPQIHIVKNGEVKKLIYRGNFLGGVGGYPIITQNDQVLLVSNGSIVRLY